MIHELKTHKPYFADILLDRKLFEVRNNDRGFKVGDQLLLKEYDAKKEIFTGRFLHRKVSYILKGGNFGVDKDYVIMGIVKI